MVDGTMMNMIVMMDINPISVLKVALILYLQMVVDVEKRILEALVQVEQQEVYLVLKLLKVVMVMDNGEVIVRQMPTDLQTPLPNQEVVQLALQELVRTGVTLMVMVVLETLMEEVEQEVKVRV